MNPARVIPSRTLGQLTPLTRQTQNTPPHPTSLQPTDHFGALQKQIAADLNQEFAGTISPQFIRLIVNEASALAASTPYPALLLPALAEEKARQASAWADRQQAIRRKTLNSAA